MLSQARQTPQSKEPAPAYAVFGPEELLRRQAIAHIIRLVLGDESQHMALAEYEGAEAALAEVLDDLRTIPFLAERRLVIVRDADPFISRYREELERYLSAPSPVGVLLLSCKTLASNTRLYKAIEKVGGVIRCESLSARSVPTWLVERCRTEYRKTLSTRDAELLAELIGTDLGVLDNELAKLSVYAGDRRRIQAEDIHALAGFHRHQKVFAMVDALANCDADEALALWQQVLATDRDAPYRAIGGLAWGVRQMLSGRSFGRAQASQPSQEELHDMLLGLLQADLAAKTGRASVQTAVEQFIVQRCAAG